jgi:4'-phosphopantetheinyl transferase
MIRLQAPEGVAVWQLELDSAPLRDNLSPDERERALRFRFERDRHRYLACRGALRDLLGAELGLAPEAVELTYGPFGKPECHGARFNVSHSHGLALLAIGADGVDIERVRNDIDPQTLGRSVFTPDELVAINTIEDFFSAWTTKEALIKAEGGGFSSPLLKKTVWPELALELLEHYTLFRLAPEPGFIATLALKKAKKAARQMSGGS